MDYFSKFLRPGAQVAPKVEVDHALEFHKSWTVVQNTLTHPDERQLSRGIKSTDVPAHLQSMVDGLVWEAARTEEGGTGACLEYLLKNDVLGTLVRLSETDRPFGIQAEVLRAVQNMVVLLDEQFLVHSAVHKAVLRLLRNCVGDDIQEQLDGRNKVVGAAGASTKSQPSEYEEDLVNLLCILCSRIRHYRELLMIFFHDKQWYRPEPLFSVEEEDEEEEEGEEEEEEEAHSEEAADSINTQETGSSDTVQVQPSDAPEDTATTTTSTTKKPEYEFLLFNYLLRFVHREGRIGDFARAGLLFLMDVAMTQVEPTQKAGDTAMSPPASSDPDPNTDAALALAEYILDGDFSDVLAAGLAAVYSLLPSKLDVRPPAQIEAAPSSGMLLGNTAGEFPEDAPERAEAERERNRAMGMEESSNPDFKYRLDHFLKLLEFLQDVLRRNVIPDTNTELDPSMLVGSAIVESILNAVRRVFLENVLYPSILECSDSDGSAVAVMSYTEMMMRTLQNGELGDMLVEFLTSEDNTEESTRSRMRPQSLLDLGSHPPTAGSTRAAKLRRRKSAAMVLLELEAPESRRPSEYFTSMGRFTLKDLLLSSLRSTSHATVTAAMQLFQIMLQQYCKLTVDKLLIVISDPHATSYPQPAMLPSASAPAHSTYFDDDDDEKFVYPGAEDTTEDPDNAAPLAVFVQPETTYWTHEREIGLYFALVARIDPKHTEDAFSTGYDHYLRDALISVQSQSCSGLDIDEEERAKLRHRLNPNDPMLSSVLESLSKFFANTPELNMALTGVLATLALCPDRSLAGWLTFSLKHEDPSTESPLPSGFKEFNDDGDDRSIDWRIEERLESGSHPLPASSLDEQSRPVVYSIFRGLVSQLERYRLLVDNFDQFLLERRQGLLFSENLTDALTLALELESASIMRNITSVPESRPKPKSKNSFVSFLTPRKNRTPKTQSLDMSTPRSHQGVEASPFGPHYQKTNAVSVEPYSAPVPSDGPWTPAKPRKWTADEEDVFAAGKWGGEVDATETTNTEPTEDRQVKTITLSHLLDNVVILEESIKELVAIIHARRSLGIDSVRYL